MNNISQLLERLARESAIEVRCYVMAYDAGCHLRWIVHTLGLSGSTLRCMETALRPWGER